MQQFQGKLFEGERLLAESITGYLEEADSPRANTGYFTLPGMCSINERAPHRLVLQDGRSEGIRITRLSHFTGDVDFVLESMPEGKA